MLYYYTSFNNNKQMKIGFVSRVSKTNAYEHTILGTQFYKPNEFARQITMDPKNMWGIVKEIVDLIRKQVNLIYFSTDNITLSFCYTWSFTTVQLWYTMSTICCNRGVFALVCFT